MTAASASRERWEEAMDDDFNTGGAIGRIFELVREFNRLLSEDETGVAGDRQALEKARDSLDVTCSVLGLFKEGLPKERRMEISSDVDALLVARNAARAEKNWSEADRLRDEIAAAGFQILDGPEGSRLKPN